MKRRAFLLGALATPLVVPASRLMAIPRNPDRILRPSKTMIYRGLRLMGVWTKDHGGFTTYEARGDGGLEVSFTTPRPMDISPGGFFTLEHTIHGDGDHSFSAGRSKHVQSQEIEVWKDNFKQVHRRIDHDTNLAGYYIMERPWDGCEEMRRPGLSRIDVGPWDL